MKKSDVGARRFTLDINRNINKMLCVVCQEVMSLKKNEEPNFYLIKKTIYPVHAACVDVMPFEVWVKARPDLKKTKRKN